MIFTTNKPLSEWGNVLHDEDLAAAILDRILERGRLIHLDGPSGRTRHLNLEEVLPAAAERARISGIRVPEFRERFANHRLVTGTRNIVEGWDSGEVTNLPLVGQPIGQLAHFRLGQVHQQLREV